jgi:hypothetical protein
MTLPHPAPYYGPQPPPRKSNTWIVWLVMGIIGVVCCLPGAAFVAFRPDSVANIVKAIIDVFGGA